MIELSVFLNGTVSSEDGFFSVYIRIYIYESIYICILHFIFGIVPNGIPHYQIKGMKDLHSFLVWNNSRYTHPGVDEG